MKTIYVILLLAVISVISPADDWESADNAHILKDRLLSLQGPGAPVIYENSVIFTAEAGLRRVGIAFSHEGFSKVHWYRHLLVPQDDPNNAPIPPGKKVPDPFKHSGVQFYIYQVPETINELEYRIITNGLWTTDPANSRYRRDPVSGLNLSVLSIPPRFIRPDPLKGLPAGLNFTFTADPGETVTVGGTFNNWDPFMYELQEGPAGIYSINIPLPPGTYQYVFFYRGQRYTDQNNPQRVYAKDRSAASVITVP
jgi:hypothetical protein